MALHAGTRQAKHATAKTNAGTATKVTGSVAFTPNSQPPTRRVSAKAQPRPIANPIAVKRRALREDEAQHAGSRRADSQANADFRCALPDCIRHQPIKPRQGQR